jgi:DNA-binding transcriptional MocR family regulator
MLQLLETLGLKALEIPTDPRTGLSIEALDLATRESQVTACLLVPNASNPLGSIMPDEHKRRLAKLTAERGVAVIEDDIYGDLYFGSKPPRPIKAFDKAGNVMLCSSFSKCLSPALRLGFVAAGRYRRQVALHKTITSGGTNPITQQVVAEYLESGAYDRHMRGLRRILRAPGRRHARGGGQALPAGHAHDAAAGRFRAVGRTARQGRYHRALRPRHRRRRRLCARRTVLGQRHVPQLPAAQLRQPAYARDRGRRSPPRRLLAS